MRFFAQVHNRFLSAMYAELHDLSLKITILPEFLNHLCYLLLHIAAVFFIIMLFSACIALHNRYRIFNASSSSSFIIVKALRIC